THSDADLARASGQLRHQFPDLFLGRFAADSILITGALRARFPRCSSPKNHTLSQPNSHTNGTAFDAIQDRPMRFFIYDFLADPNADFKAAFGARFAGGLSPPASCSAGISSCTTKMWAISGDPAENAVLPVRRVGPDFGLPLAEIGGLLPS